MNNDHESDIICVLKYLQALFIIVKNPTEEYRNLYFHGKVSEKILFLESIVSTDQIYWKYFVKRNWSSFQIWNICLHYAVMAVIFYLSI